MAQVLHREAAFLGGPREVLSSVGVGVRFNVLGFVLAEVDWVRPLDRPDKGSYLTNLNSGF